MTSVKRTSRLPDVVIPRGPGVGGRLQVICYPALVDHFLHFFSLHKEGVGDTDKSHTHAQKCLAPRAWSEGWAREQEETPWVAPTCWGQLGMASCNLTFLQKPRAPGTGRRPEATKIWSHFGCRGWPAL